MQLASRIKSRRWSVALAPTRARAFRRWSRRSQQTWRATTARPSGWRASAPGPPPPSRAVGYRPRSDCAGFTAPSRKLNDEIGLALADGRTSAVLAEKLRFVQGVGNDAVHPNLGADGELIEVTLEDLTVIISALDEFFDAFFVKPARHAAIMKSRAERKKGTGGATT